MKAKEPSTKPLTVACSWCGGVLSTATTNDDVNPAAIHPKCEGTFLLTQVVPLWPRTRLRAVEVDRLKKAWPGLDWDAAWGSGAVDSFPLRLEPLPDAGGTDNRFLSDPEQERWEGPQTAPPKLKPLWLMECSVCPPRHILYTITDVARAVERHRGKFPGHRVSVRHHADRDSRPGRLPRVGRRLPVATAVA